MKKILYKLSLFAFFITAVMLLSIHASADASVQRYGRTTITDKATAYAYDTLVSSLMVPNSPDTVEFDQDKGLGEDQLAHALEMFISDYPECFWLGLSYQYSSLSDGTVVSLTFDDRPFEGDELIRARKSLDSAVQNILLGMPNTTNYDKALYLHDALCKSVVYELEGEHQTAYGALVSGKAVCAGYATAYQLLLQRAGIDAWTVSGTSQKAGEEPVPHAWNVVWLSDGVCVYTDTTWDDDETSVFHCYFNISKSEMAKDHVADALYPLPKCTHDDKSYFDVNDRSVSVGMSISELVSLFGPEQGGARSAVLYCENGDTEAVKKWIDLNQRDIFDALGCLQFFSKQYRLTVKGSEIHLTVTAAFPTETYKITLVLPDSIKNYGDSEQYVIMGESMTEMTLIAAEGYGFPANYHSAAENGLTVTRINAKMIKISGTPERNMTLSLSPATRMKQAATPTAKYTPDGNGCGILSNIEAGMRYSFDGISWIDITSDDDIFLDMIKTNTLYIIRLGNGEDTLDSDMQMLEIPNAYVPLMDPEIHDDNKPVGGFFGCGSTAYGYVALIFPIALCGVIIKKKKI